MAGIRAADLQQFRHVSRPDFCLRPVPHDPAEFFVGCAVDHVT